MIGGIPFEVFRNIASHADQFTLLQLSVVSRVTWEAAGPYLYRRLRITEHNAEAVLLGLASESELIRPSNATHISDSDTLDVGLEQDPVQGKRSDLGGRKRRREISEYVRHLRVVSLPAQISHRMSYVGDSVSNSGSGLERRETWNESKNGIKASLELKLENVTSISFGSQAILDMYNWHFYERINDPEIELDHPFIRCLKRSLSVDSGLKNVCVTWPRITRRHFDEFRARLLVRQQHTNSEVESGFDTYVRHLSVFIHKFQHWGIDNGTGSNLAAEEEQGEGRTSSTNPTQSRNGNRKGRKGRGRGRERIIPNFTIHNLINGRIPTESRHIRVFFSRCDCPMMGSKRDDCYQHINYHQRRSMIMILSIQLMQKHSDRSLSRSNASEGENLGLDDITLEEEDGDKGADGKWGIELICEKSTESSSKTPPARSDKTLIRSRWERLKVEAIENCPAFADHADKVKIISWEDAEVCSCCGEKDGV
ncbi:uncharacterized protein I303_104318 [Kwoniella dejecticola CBS 10117]|uniref:F-box domain-containing protein n=1 Tax=Kwoniella dejecticola CBS 10117 TaxID=1296121 RepID=A0A1A6A5P1_9TREE|nr:uncharacterized protein I303_04708 [Kwoniella dejecticola CBS 10117]OBR85373.1 hypothetical protein I303_04708 [Kwoniella dejecticola CBS 10117]